MHFSKSVFFQLKIPIIPAIKDQLQKVSGRRIEYTKNMSRKTLASQREGVAAVKKILDERKNSLVESTSKDSN